MTKAEAFALAAKHDHKPWARDLLFRVVKSTSTPGAFAVEGMRITPHPRARLGFR